MSYCTASDVRLILETNLTDTEISCVIETSDAEIDKTLGVQGASNKLVKKLSMLLSAHTIKTRQPQSQSIGEYRESSENILEVWEREIERIYRLYEGILIQSTDYEYIDESERYPEDG